VVVAGAGIVLWLRRHAERPLFSIGVAAALVPLSYLPNLVASDNWSAYRTQVALSALIALYASLGAIALWILLRDWLRDGVSEGALRATQRVAFAAAVVVVAASAYLAADNVTSLVVDPQAIELRMLRSQVAAIPPSATRIAFVETDWHGGPTSRVYYDEFGLPSTSRIWALRASLDLIRHEQGRQPIPAIDFFPATTSSVPTNEPIVDVRSIRALR
jgi:hypothetical protein